MQFVTICFGIWEIVFRIWNSLFWDVADMHVSKNLTTTSYYSGLVFQQALIACCILVFVNVVFEVRNLVFEIVYFVSKNNFSFYSEPEVFHPSSRSSSQANLDPHPPLLIIIVTINQNQDLLSILRSSISTKMDPSHVIPFSSKFSKNLIKITSAIASSKVEPPPE